MICLLNKKKKRFLISFKQFDIFQIRQYKHIYIFKYKM